MKLRYADVYRAAKTLKMLGCERPTLIVPQMPDERLMHGITVVVCPWMKPDEWQLVQPETVDAILGPDEKRPPPEDEGLEGVMKDE